VHITVSLAMDIFTFRMGDSCSPPHPIPHAHSSLVSPLSSFSRALGTPSGVGVGTGPPSQKLYTLWDHD
jgi:hypothetical protein